MGSMDDLHDRRKDKFSENKKVILALLHELNVEHVVVSYSGYADSGQIDYVSVLRNGSEIGIGKIRVGILQDGSTWNDEEKKWVDKTETKEMSLEEALQD